MPRRAEPRGVSPHQKSLHDDFSEDNLLYGIPRPSVLFGEAADRDDDPFASPSKYLNSPFKPFTGRQASPHALEWVDLGLRALEKRVTTAWDRADDLFADAPPRAAVIFLHGNGDSGAGAQAWLSHAWATEDLEEYLAERCGAIMVFPDAPTRTSVDVPSDATSKQAGSAEDFEDDDAREVGWLSRSSLLWAPHSEEASSSRPPSKQAAPVSSSDDLAWSMAAVDDVIEELYERWPNINPSNVLLGGFGAGGVLALHCALAREAAADSATAAARTQSGRESDDKLSASKGSDSPQVSGERNSTRHFATSQLPRFAGVFAFSGFLPATSPQWSLANVKWQRRPMPASVFEDSSDEDNVSDNDEDVSDSEEDINSLALSPSRRRQAQADRDNRALARAKSREHRRIAAEQRRAARVERREAAIEGEEVAATVDPARWVVLEAPDFARSEEPTGEGEIVALGEGSTRAESEESVKLRDDVRSLPVLLSHGESDEVVPHAWGLATARGLHLAKRRSGSELSNSMGSCRTKRDEGNTAREGHEVTEHKQGSPRFDVSFGSFPDAQHELTSPAIEKFAAWVVHVLSLPSRNPVAFDPAPASSASSSQEHSESLENPNAVADKGSMPLISDSDVHATPEVAKSTQSQSFHDEMSSKSSGSTNASVAQEMPDPFSLPYTVAKAVNHESSVGSNHYVATFQAPPGWADALCRQPVSARGASFILERSSAHSSSSEETVTCSFYSTAPKVTAAAIHARLVKRIQDPTPPGAEECSIM